MPSLVEAALGLVVACPPALTRVGGQAESACSSPTPTPYQVPAKIQPRLLQRLAQPKVMGVEKAQPGDRLWDSETGPGPAVLELSRYCLSHVDGTKRAKQPGGKLSVPGCLHFNMP